MAEINLSIPNQMKVVNGELMLTFLRMPHLLRISKHGELLDQPYRATNPKKWDSSEVVFKSIFGFEYYESKNQGDPELEKHQSNGFFKSVSLNKNVRIRIIGKQSILISNFDSQLKIDCDKILIGLGAFSDSTFWVSYVKGGVQIMNLEGKKLRYFLADYLISDVYKDRENNYWFCTLNNGLFHTRNGLINSLTERGSFMNLVADPNGTITTSTFEGDIYEINSCRKLELKKVSEDQRGTQICYSTTLQTTVALNGGKMIFHDNILDLRGNFSGSSRSLIDLGGKFAVAAFSYYAEVTYDGEVIRFNSPTNTNDAISFKDKTYCATNTGIYRVDGSTLNRVGPWEMRIECLNSIRDNLLIGSHGFGLFILTEKGKLIHLDRNELGTDFINEIYVESNTEFWVCTTQGICKVVLKENWQTEIDRLDYQAGLISNEVQDLIIIEDTVWVATSSGICYFPKSIISQRTRDEHNYFLEFIDLEINDHSVGFNDRGLSYGENRVQFEFKAKSFNQFDKIQYRYRLKGAEKKWNYTTSREAVYPKLGPGNYTFFVQVKGKNEHWNFQEISWQFTIHPPFWKTWWFLSIVIGSLILLVYLFFRFRILLYNADLVREILRQIAKRLRKETGHLIVKEGGNNVKINSKSIFYVKSDGNYLEIHHENGKTVIREKIGNFLTLVPDPLEYLRVRRSYIIRIDQVQQKGKKEVVVNGETIQIGKTYMDELDKIQL